MLKSFHVNGKFEEILPHLASQPNQSFYICSLIMADMKRESELSLIKQAIREVLSESNRPPVSWDEPKPVKKTKSLSKVNLDI